MSGVRWDAQDGIGRMTLDHPPVNILTREVLGQCRAALSDAASDRTLRVLVLGAEGPHFSAGADVGEHLPGSWEEMIPEFLATIQQLDAFPVPVLAAVQGRCLGGGFELILPADLIVAAEDAAFGQPEIVLGVMAPAACALLPDTLPATRAAHLLYTGDPLCAADARALGLVQQVVSVADLGSAADTLAGRIARHSAAALRATKAALKGDRLAERSARLERMGSRYATDLMTTRDAVEGLSAFLEKRRPQWRHA